MVKINNFEFHEKPCMCGACPAFFNGSTTRMPHEHKGRCLFFDVEKGYYANLPRRCERLFSKAMLFPEGTELVITTN